MRVFDEIDEFLCYDQDNVKYRILTRYYQMIHLNEEKNINAIHYLLLVIKRISKMKDKFLRHKEKQLQKNSKLYMLKFRLNQVVVLMILLSILPKNRLRN